MSNTRYPEHIEDLCQAILKGDETGWGPLHDALIEAGYPATAERHCNRSTCLRHPAFCDLIHAGTNPSLAPIFWPNNIELASEAILKERKR